MKAAVQISILCEDQARMGFKDKIFLAQHGFSAFVEAGAKILFDTGATDVFLHNAKLLGIDPAAADLVVLSHGHWDHSDGLKALAGRTRKKLRLLLHPGVFADRHRASGEYNGVGFTRQQIAQNFELIESVAPCEIAPDVFFLGQIPRVNDFEARRMPFHQVTGDRQVPDFILDDSALAIRTARGLVIVSGCSHAGICNIVQQARTVTGENRLHAVLGGFHLLGNPEQLERTIAFFETNRVEHLYPMHCTDLAALSRFHQRFKVRKLCAGDRITFGNT